MKSSFAAIVFAAGSLCLIQSALGAEPSVPDAAMRALVEDNKAAMALVERLESPAHETRGAAIGEVLAHPEAASPPVLYSLTNALANENRMKEAVFWYHVGKMRVTYDIRRNRDQSLGDVPQILAMRLVKPVVQAVYFNDLDSAVDVAKSAIAWDDAHAHNYNPLWPAPHGLGIFKPGEAGLAPEKDWPAMNEGVHAQWLKVISKVVADAKASQVQPDRPVTNNAAR